MPLVRYELQNEYKLADRNLVSAASKNDPEAILDGIAMAGLVGLVRQLGNLAQFAAELFHELHDEIKATAARGHELVSRLQQLEADLPVAEKALLSETNQLHFAYSTGAEWHARICIRENHCSEGDLPQFIQNYYKECRSPPKFSLLDKFDINGAGACQKRYSDPSFFKAEWASSELKKAENVLKDRKARQIKKKRNNQGIGRAKSDTSEPRPPPRRVRYSSLSSDTWGSYSDISTPRSDVGTKPKMSESYTQISEREALQDLFRKSLWPPPKLQTLREFLETDEDFDTLRLSAKEIEAETQTARYKGIKIMCDFQQKAVETVKEESHDEEGTEDTASEADQFMDAMTTMESETESESGDRVEFMSNSVSAIPCPSEYDSLKQQQNTCIQEMDHQSKDQLDSSVLLMSDVSLSTSPSFSADSEENISLDNQAQNLVLQPTEDFAKDEMRVQKRETPILPPKKGVAEICPDLTVPHLLSEPRMDSENQNAETVHEDLCFSQESEHANYECLRHECPNSPPLSVRMPPQLLANNPCMAELNTDIRPIPLTLSADSSHSSSRMPESPPSNILADLSGETELDSSNASSSSSASSPRSPLFSALNSPMSPIRFVCISTSSISKRTAAAMIRPSSPTLESKILSPRRLEGVPPTPPPLPPPRWRSKQALQSSFESHKIMQAPPRPPPFPPPPRLLSNLVQPIRQPEQTSRSTPHGHRHDALIESISAYDRSKLRKVTAAQKQLAKPKTMDEILLEQIRTKSFRLRHTAVQKHDDATHPKPEMINVAAILEKANAIRQAFAGSDEEDANQGWTEAEG